MSETVTIFGKKYPAYEYNATEFRYILPDFFARHKHFSGKEYYDEVVKSHPEYKSLFHPSEKQIEKMIIKAIGWGAMDGANSVHYIEKKFGIKIAGDYKYPNDMSDIEYHFYKLMKKGLLDTEKNTNINTETKEQAYIVAWQKLHYPNQNLLKTLQDLYFEIIKLNNWLNQYKFDINNKRKLIYFLAGITYKLPIKDIMMFVNDEKPNKEEYKNKFKPLEKYGMRHTDFHWFLSDDTIRDIEQKMQHRKNISQQFFDGSKKVKTLQKDKEKNFLLSFLGAKKHK
jgi:hypothetical protein